mmetsp:Transcript_26039/g.46144  ORF Transcript_26039/g.46144 Transcript_26039/m.46144 type:complete len:82 (+) Transcript_26039:38-283(+)|eukprot:CAMPEP_0115124096 /NCGR_PEP_ID=MMETSP0227-20121206/48049_1 /TAXON_ID=89957 /ORGANISM="Polarella glacialis, Strain CCMP 1383" /LENGTH=81 /DNA_ID=CAMNT_0002526823 /DNA_START=9 /DNA_END=254 /DNA_ORIENTATION=+
MEGIRILVGGIRFPVYRLNPDRSPFALEELHSNNDSNHNSNGSSSSNLNNSNNSNINRFFTSKSNSKRRIWSTIRSDPPDG